MDWGEGSGGASSRRRAIASLCALLLVVGCGDDGGQGAVDPEQPGADGGQSGQSGGGGGGAAGSAGAAGAVGAAGDAGAADDASTDPPDTGVASTFEWDHVVATQSGDAAYGVAVDGKGHVYVLGHLGDPFDFGGGEIMTSALGSEFVLHLDADGNYVWEYILPDAEHHDIAVDDTGRVYVTGRGDLLGADLPDGGRIERDDTFVLALDTDGSFRWGYAFAVGQDERGAIAASAEGAVYVTGGMVDDGDFGGGMRTGPAEYTLALTASGEYDWDRTFGQHRAGLFRDLVVDGAGNLYQVFSYGGSADFGGGERSARDDGDAVILSLQADGTYRWDRPVDSGAPQRLAVEDNGNLYYAVRLYDAFDYGGGERTRVGSGDGIVVAYDTDGTHRWDHQSGIEDGDDYRDVGVDDAGNVYVVGNYLNPTSVGGAELPNFGLSDLYMLGLSNDGSYQWDFPWGGEDSELGLVWAEGAGEGRVVVAGNFDSDADFGGGLRNALRNSIFVFSHSVTGTGD